MSLPLNVPPLPARAQPAFDWIARRAAQLLACPMALVSLVDVRGQVWPGVYGVPEPWSSERVTPLTHSFCRYVVESGRPFTVTDAREHPLVATNEAVHDLGVVAYAGVPLTLRGGTPGALGVVDHEPRLWTPEQLADLEQLAGLCSDLLGSRVPAQRG